MSISRILARSLFRRPWRQTGGRTAVLSWSAAAL